MTFELLPTIGVMSDLYEKPLNPGRFQNYLKLLQGDNKGDLAMPIGGFNPMAKDHLLARLAELKELKAEDLMQQIISDLNARVVLPQYHRSFKIALNLSDDLKGGWTNRHTSDYDSKFKINALVNRGFITPIFWSGETFSTNVINERTLEYIFRTVAWIIQPRPRTLKEHVEHEKFAVEESGIRYPEKDIDFDSMASFYKQHWSSDNYNIIFNFFYGDAAAKSLEFSTNGIKGEMPGFEYVRQLVKKQRNATK